jgi:hypothetical protein
VTKGNSVLMRNVQDGEEEVPRHAETDQEVYVQPDGVSGYKRLLAHDNANEPAMQVKVSFW